jgi:YidC/Oxa1 family membrane protein insertase
MMVPKSNKNKAKPTKKTKEGFEESMSQVQTQMIYIMPLIIGFFSYGFPIGLSLYWNTFTIIGAVQQYVVVGPGALGKYLPKNLRKEKK